MSDPQVRDHKFRPWSLAGLAGFVGLVCCVGLAGCSRAKKGFNDQRLGNGTER